ncbi:hypothetical protein [Burkholderia sp. Bp9143]|uniref:hypothetical protein n=1 Tax=Burkholderia sp. Bp9143 TaxID=2184574 RepID=UPI001624B650|nr:hypothetical protein [Burkholderia sp. Bp9143]
MPEPLPDRPRREHVAPHADEFMESQRQKVVRTDLLRDAVVDRLRFLDIRAEHPVEDDQHAAVVPVEIARVATVMRAMIRDVSNTASNQRASPTTRCCR